MAASSSPNLYDRAKVLSPDAADAAARGPLIEMYDQIRREREGSILRQGGAHALHHFVGELVSESSPLRAIEQCPEALVARYLTTPAGRAQLLAKFGMTPLATGDS